MEKSTSDDKMPDHEFGNEACREGIQEGEAPNAQKLWSPLFFTAAIGMALFWSCFFTMLMRNSFMDGDIDQLWYCWRKRKLEQPARYGGPILYPRGDKGNCSLCS